MEIVVRATIVFWLLWAVLRAAGKRELSDLTPFELVVLMVLGDIIQQGVTEEDMSLTGAALAVSTMILWAVGFSYAGFRSPRLRRRLESAPTIVVRHGVIDQRALAVQRMTIDDLLDEVRVAGISRIADIDYAVLEADGKMSFLRRDDGDEVDGDPGDTTDRIVS